MKNVTGSVAYCRSASPLGEMLLVAHGDKLAGVYFDDQKYLPAIESGWREDATLPVLRTARRQLAEYFAGARTGFDLPLAARGTVFQRAVWSAIAEVPWGRTAAYAEIAARAGHAGSARAAGAATGRNPWSIVVPCHRIVATGGALTGYAGGLSRKEALLALEGRGAGAALAA